MNFTREPIIETIVVPKDGFKLVVRNSKIAGVEEYFVDSVEIISFGPALFFRSMERPKSFLLPVSDYEILEVRETKVVLKHTGVASRGKTAKPEVEAEAGSEEEASAEKRRGRRQRRRKGREQPVQEEVVEESPTEQAGQKPAVSEGEAPVDMPKAFASILPPPSSLVSASVRKPEAAEESAELPSPGKEEEVLSVSPEKETKEAGSFSASRFLRKITRREEQPEESSKESSKESSEAEE